MKADTVIVAAYDFNWALQISSFDQDGKTKSANRLDWSRNKCNNLSETITKAGQGNLITPPIWGYFALRIDNGRRKDDFLKVKMRGLALLALASAFLLIDNAVKADERVAGECLISVRARTYRDGRCLITLYPGGGFQAGGGRVDEYFATVDIDAASGGAQAFRNGVEAESHAHNPLGDVARQGGFWVNANERVRARQPGTRPRAAVPMSDEAPRMVPVAGSSTIDIPNDDRWN